MTVDHAFPFREPLQVLGMQLVGTEDLGVGLGGGRWQAAGDEEQGGHSDGRDAQTHDLQSSAAAPD